jgi:uncharacterized membrane protein YebE (DUF533 family)
MLAACGGLVGQGQVKALLSDFAQRLAEDGLDRRIESIAQAVNRPEHAREVLRVAALLACVSNGVNDAERCVMQRLADRLHLGDSGLEQALSEAQRALVR